MNSLEFKKYLKERVRIYSYSEAYLILGDESKSDILLNEKNNKVSLADFIFEDKKVVVCRVNSIDLQNLLNRTLSKEILINFLKRYLNDEEICNSFPEISEKTLREKQVLYLQQSYQTLKKEFELLKKEKEELLKEIEKDKEIIKNLKSKLKKVGEEKVKKLKKADEKKDKKAIKKLTNAHSVKQWFKAQEAGE